MVFDNFENKILKEYKEKIKKDNSIKNIIATFVQNYSAIDEKFDRNESADMLLFQYGVYDWGDGKNLEIDFCRQLIKNEDIIQIHITVKIPYDEKFSSIEPYEEWYNSSGSEFTLDSWQEKIQGMPIFNIIESMKYEIEVWKENAE